MIEATLLAEVSRVQHDKTLLAVRDLADSIKTTEPNERSYGSKDRTAQQYKHELLAGLRRLGEEAR